MARITQVLHMFWLIIPILGGGVNNSRDVESVIDLQERLIKVESALKSFEQNQNNLTDRLEKIELKLKKKDFGGQDEGTEATKKPAILRHCADVYDQVSQLSGVYTIQPSGFQPFPVYCDMTTDGGGWTVFQKRGDFFGIPQNNFYRGWHEYKDGFGDLKTEFWMGLSKISSMTRPQNGAQALRVDLESLDFNTKYAQYQNFTVEDEKHDFILRIGSYSGNAGDSLSVHNLQKFSTYDRDNDERKDLNCAKHLSGAWWYRHCHDCDLNGLNLKRKAGSHGIYWHHFNYQSVSRTEMKFRPTGWTPKTNYKE